MKGVWNKILRVDLNEKKATTEDVPDEVYEYFLGGEGLAAWVMWKECPRGTTAFDPANRLTFCHRAHAGHQAERRGQVGRRRDLPRLQHECRVLHHPRFGIEMKQAGYDAVVVHGRADKPVYIVVDDDRVKIKDAARLWGKDAYAAEDMIQEAEGETFEVVTTGQAGERLVRYRQHPDRQEIVCRPVRIRRRHGLQAPEGHRRPRQPDLPDLRPAGQRRTQPGDQQTPGRRQRGQAGDAPDLHLGTASATGLFAPQGNLPVKNYSLARHPEGEANLGGQVVRRKAERQTLARCRYCVIRVPQQVRSQERPVCLQGQGPGVRILRHDGLQPLDRRPGGRGLRRASWPTATRWTRSPWAAVLAWAMESYEKGVLTKEDTYGIDLTWGNAAGAVEMVKKIGERAPGLGYLLGEGCKIASERIGQGSEDWALQMKGQEIAAHNWRAQYISALNYCTGVASGPNHERGNSQHIWVGHILLPEWGIDHVENEERWSWEKASDRNAKFHDYCNVINSAVHCKFQEFASYNLTDLLGTINTCTGLNWSQEDMRRCGERITNLQKLLNIRYGWKTADDFNYPKRFMEPVSEGVAAGKIPVGLDDAIVDYYRSPGMGRPGLPDCGQAQRSSGWKPSRAERSYA